jgi:tetratricopeptide (TPR) repeat protein
MKLRAILVGLSATLILLTTTPVQAQFRRFGNQLRIPRSRSGLNPVHERTKTAAQAAYQRGDYQRAIDLTSSVLRANTRDDVAYYLRASARVDMALQQESKQLMRSGIADAREAIRLKGLDNPIYYIPYLYGMTSLSMLEKQNKHAEVAEKYAGQAINRAGVRAEDKAHLLFQRGRARVYLKKHNEGISDFKTAIRLVPSQIGFHLDLADAYAKADRVDEAVDAYRRAMTRFPDEPVVYNNRGMFLQRQGKSTAALADFTRALQLNPRYYYAYTNRGFTLLQAGDAAAAENDLTASLKLNSKQPTVYGLRASARLSRGMIDEAITDHQQVLRLTPNNPVAHANLGYARFYSGDYAGARRSFGKAVELDAKLRHVNPWRYLSMALAGEEDAARSRFSATIDANAKKRNWIDNLLSYLSGQIGDDELLKSVNDIPGVKTAQLCEAHFFIAQRHSMAGETEIADKHFRQAIETGQKQLAAFRAANFALKKKVSVSDTTE